MCVVEGVVRDFSSSACVSGRLDMCVTTRWCVRVLKMCVTLCVRACVCMNCGGDITGVYVTLYLFYVGLCHCVYGTCTKQIQYLWYSITVCLCVCVSAHVVFGVGGMTNRAYVCTYVYIWCVCVCVALQFCWQVQVVAVCCISIVCVGITDVEH